MDKPLPGLPMEEIFGIARQALADLPLPFFYYGRALTWAIGKYYMTPIEEDGELIAPYTRLFHKPAVKDCLHPFGCYVEYELVFGFRYVGLFLCVWMGTLCNQDPSGYIIMDIRTSIVKHVPEVKFLTVERPPDPSSY